jgi:hypothetical protein
LDLAASERFYRTVLSVLGVESSDADAGLVEWEDRDDGSSFGTTLVPAGVRPAG